MREAIGTFATAIAADWDCMWTHCPGRYTAIGVVEGAHVEWSQQNVWRLAVHYWRAHVQGRLAMRPPDDRDEATIA